MKAVLQERGMPIPRIHSLADLLALISKSDTSFMVIQADTVVLEGFAVQFRYPGFSANKMDAKTALTAAENVCSFIRNKLVL